MRAGKAFKGQLQQNFIVLHNSCPPGVVLWVCKLVGTVNKPQMKRKLVDGERSEPVAAATPEKNKKQN
jgi:hypothetical protein